MMPRPLQTLRRHRIDDWPHAYPPVRNSPANVPWSMLGSLVASLFLRWEREAPVVPKPGRREPPFPRSVAAARSRCNCSSAD